MEKLTLDELRVPESIKKIWKNSTKKDLEEVICFLKNQKKWKAPKVKIIIAEKGKGKNEQQENVNKFSDRQYGDYVSWANECIRKGCYSRSRNFIRKRRS